MTDCPDCRIGVLSARADGSSWCPRCGSLPPPAPTTSRAKTRPSSPRALRVADVIEALDSKESEA